jgi:predicted metal-dependent hydrolase
MELDESGGLVVVAPAHWSKKFITAMVARNIPRVERFLMSARNRQMKPLRCVDGEKHLYLGESYNLVVHVATGRGNQVEIMDEDIHVSSSIPTTIRTVLQQWYSQQAPVVFQGRLVEVSRRAPWMQYREIQLRTRRMKRTWGNCSSAGLIKLNTHLVKAPLAIVDSVIAHELCHLQELNHGPAFYALLEKLNPDWRRDRASLRSKGFVYLRT